MPISTSDVSANPRCLPQAVDVVIVAKNTVTAMTDIVKITMTMMSEADDPEAFSHR